MFQPQLAWMRQLVECGFGPFEGNTTQVIATMSSERQGGLMTVHVMQFYYAWRQFGPSFIQTAIEDHHLILFVPRLPMNMFTCSTLEHAMWYALVFFVITSVIVSFGRSNIHSLVLRPMLQCSHGPKQTSGAKACCQSQGCGQGSEGIKKKVSGRRGREYGRLPAY